MEKLFSVEEEAGLVPSAGVLSFIVYYHGMNRMIWIFYFSTYSCCVALSSRNSSNATECTPVPVLYSLVHLHKTVLTPVQIYLFCKSSSQLLHKKLLHEIVLNSFSSRLWWFSIVQKSTIIVIETMVRSHDVSLCLFIYSWDINFLREVSIQWWTVTK